MSLDDQFARLQALLSVEEGASARGEVLSFPERLAQRQAIHAHLAHLRADIEQVTARLNRLPAFPDLSYVRWAQSLLAFPNGRILVVDSLFPAESASLLQVLVLDFAGRVRLHHCVATEYTLSRSDRMRFGVSDQHMQDALPLPHLWPLLLEALHGCYLLACDLRWIGMVLEQEAQRCQLEVPVLIGEDLLIRAIRFYQASGCTTLTGLCRLIGHPLAVNADSTQRARGQLALLGAMAQGITGSASEDKRPGSIRDPKNP